MALIRKINSKAKSVDNSGFGNNSGNFGDRFYTKSGKTNITRHGVSFLGRYSWYHTMINMSGIKFFFLLFGIYIVINLIFAAVYYLIGVEHLVGIESGTALGQFTDVFFFSTQTFTTVGYGRISPRGFLTSTVATFEAFLGLLNFAIATGLFYGRFSRAQAFLKFSEHAVIAPFKSGLALMFRMAPFKNNSLSDAEVRISLVIRLEENGKPTNKFYTLNTDISKINALALSWTVVHPMDENSPLYAFKEEDFKNTQLELVVHVTAFDDVFSNHVVARTSYVSSEIKWGRKFKLMYHPNENGNKTAIDLNLLSTHEEIKMHQEENGEPMRISS